MNLMLSFRDPICLCFIGETET
jgi:hypothetical protein